MIRLIIGIVLGICAWMASFELLAITTSKLWPDYGVEARRWISEGVFSMTVGMATLTLLYWILAEIAAGAVATLVGRRLIAAWILAALVALYLVSLHFVLLWSRFPWWYNLAVVFSSVPAVWCGGALAAPRSAAPTPIVGNG